MIKISHYTCIVIGEDPEEQLAPFSEDREVAPYRAYADSETLKWYEKEYAGENDGATPENYEALATWLAEHWGEEFLYEPQGGIYQMSTSNTQGYWDWYQIGGRWRGYFKLKAMAMDTAAIAEIGAPGVFDNDVRYDADQAQKCDIDAEGMRSLSGDAAGARWDRAQTVFVGTPEPDTWEEVLARHTDDEGNKDAGAARAEYGEQPRVRAVREHDAECNREERFDDALLGWGNGVEEFACSREEYVQRARNNAITPYAYIKDGEWFAPGKMGWWGMSSEGEEDRHRFAREFNEMFDALPDETLVTLFDLHT